MDRKALATVFAAFLCLSLTTWSSPASGVGAGGGVDVYFFSGSSTGTETSPPVVTCHQLSGVAINFVWGSGSPGGSCPSNSFGAYIEGSIIGPTTGTVQFCSENDDRFRFQIQSTLVIDDWNIQANGDCLADNGNGYGSFSMVSGQRYPIRVWFNENTGGAVMRLFWQYGALEDYEIVPITSLSNCYTNFTTLSQGGWSNTASSSPLTSSWFSTNFPTGLKIGALTNSVTLTSGDRVRQFLPQSGTPAVLSGGSRTNLTRSDLKNTLAGQVAALTLNLAHNPGLAGKYLAVGYSDTVSDLLGEANAALNGPASKTTLSSLNYLVEYVNLSFPNGVDEGRIVCSVASPTS